MNMTITESDKRLLSFLVAVLLLLLLAFLVLRPLADKNSDLKRQITAAKDQEVVMDLGAALAEDAGKVEEVLRTGGFSKPSSPVQKIPEEYKKDLEAEIAKAQEQVKQLESELAECAVSRQDLELISDYYRTRAEKYRILGEIPQTASTFAISGYVPAAKADAIVKELSEHYGAAAPSQITCRFIYIRSSQYISPIQHL